MISYLKTLIFFVIPIQVLAANTITVEAPKILLKNVDFSVTFRGDFSIDEQFFLEHDGKTYSRHIRYVFEDKSEKIWSTMKTIRFTCPVSRDKLEEILEILILFLWMELIP